MDAKRGERRVDRSNRQDMARDCAKRSVEGVYTSRVVGDCAHVPAHDSERGWNDQSMSVLLAVFGSVWYVMSPMLLQTDRGMPHNIGRNPSTAARAPKATR